MEIFGYAYSLVLRVICLRIRRGGGSNFATGKLFFPFPKFADRFPGPIQSPTEYADGVRRPG